MAAVGHVRESYWEGCSPDRIEFVRSFRQLLGTMPNPKQSARALRLNVPLSSLSCYWSGRRVPGVDRLRAMHEALSGSIAPERAPVSLAELELLRSSAVRRCRDVAAASNVSRGPISAPALSPGAAVGTLAAPLRAVDRRDAMNGAAIQMLDALVAAHAAGDRRTVLGIAWSTSKTMSMDEICTTVCELHARGHADLVEAVLMGGRERSQEDAIRISLALIARGLTMYAELVMSVALPPEGG